MKFDINWIPQIIQVIPMIVNGIEALTKNGKPDETSKQDWDKQRQDAAVVSLGSMITNLEVQYGKEAFADKEFQVLLRKLIDDYVALENFARNFKKKES